MIECDYSYGEMTVEHALLHCEKWNREHEETIERFHTKNIQSILNSRQGTRAVTEFVHRTPLLEQFNLVREKESERRERYVGPELTWTTHEKMREKSSPSLHFMTRT
jgi:hypothetical protein